MAQFSRTVPAIFVLLVSHTSENLSLAWILSTFEALTESNQVIYIQIFKHIYIYNVCKIKHTKILISVHLQGSERQ